MKNSALKKFRTIALLEGTSFLILLLIAMPLKYMLDMPLFVRIMGSIHGVLFLLYVFYLLKVKQQQQWNIQKAAIAFLASLLPCGTFILDAKVLKKEIAAL